MSQKDKGRINKNTIVKIAVPVAIVLVVAGIWFMKNAETTEQPSAGNDSSDFALHATEPIDLEQLKSYGLPVIIDFGADTCAPCKEMAPVLEELNKELRGRAIIKFIDVGKYPELAKGYPVSYIPTQVFYDASGQPFYPQNPVGVRLNIYENEAGEHTLTTHVGGMTKEQLMTALEEMGME